MLEALVFHLKLIVITLGEGDDAQVIFETLNSAGQPLLAMDLVRNNIFHRAEAQHSGSGNARERAEQLYRQVWAPFDDAWWRTPAPFARPQRPRIDHFLANLLTAETGERTTVRELYAEYRAWATPIAALASKPLKTNWPCSKSMLLLTKILRGTWTGTRRLLGSAGGSGCGNIQQHIRSPSRSQRIRLTN